MLFVDNHDSQRERWKPHEEPGPDWPPNATCVWDGVNINICRFNYKNGLRYNLVQRYMLAWPYGDAVWLSSSYAWTYFEEGPPGVRADSLRDLTAPVNCRPTPTTSPVSAIYDADGNRWVCEHRWKGVMALVRFRRVVGKNHAVHSTWDVEGGFIGYSLGDIAFVALSRGYDFDTGMGSNASLNLTGRQTPLREGTYCNLANELGPVPEPRYWTRTCTGRDPVEVDVNGTVAHGFLRSGEMVVLHSAYNTHHGAGREEWAETEASLEEVVV